MSAMASVEVVHTGGLVVTIHDSAVEEYRTRGFTPVDEVDQESDDDDEAASPSPGDSTPVSPAAGGDQEINPDQEV